jgi:hypothetical protein
MPPNFSLSHEKYWFVIWWDARPQVKNGSNEIDLIFPQKGGQQDRVFAQTLKTAKHTHIEPYSGYRGSPAGL